MTTRVDCDPVGAGCGCGSSEPVDLRDWWRVIVAAVLTVNAMTISLAINSSAASPSTRMTVNGVLFALALACAALVGGPLARNGWRQLRRGQVTVEAMFAAGIVGALTASLVAALGSHGHTYFEVVALLLVVYAFGQKLSSAAQSRALASVLEWAPEATVCTVLGDDGALRKIQVAELRPGMSVIVNPGETIPADGVVEAGGALVREAEMTGEAFAVAKRPGDTVWAGTHCLDARLQVRATAGGRERRIDQIVEAVERARATPSTLQRQVDRVVGWFLPAVLAVAAATFVGWTLAAGFERGLFNAMAVLLVACPCALGLATPLAVWGAIARLASRGLVVRGGDSIERLAAVAAAVFDKTGTLTEAQAVLVDFVASPRADMTSRDVRRLVQAVERSSRHPVAAAFNRLDDEPGAWRVSGFRLLPGTGVAAVVEDGAGRSLRVSVGDAARLAGGEDAGWEELRGRLRKISGARVLAVVIDGRPAALAAVDEHLRDSWPAALERLGELGVEALVFTGDCGTRARRVAADRVLAELSAEDKLAEVRSLQAEGRHVLFVGDGVNDAAAMAASEVSVGVVGGAELAAEVADITWRSQDLGVLPWAVDLARRTLTTIRGNLRFALAYNIAGVALAVAGLLHPVAAAVLMTCSSLIVTWRAASILDEDQAEAVAVALEPAAETG